MRMSSTNTSPPAAAMSVPSMLSKISMASALAPAGPPTAACSPSPPSTIAR